MEREMALNKIHANRGGPLADNARAATLIMFDSNRNRSNILFKKEFDDIEQSAPSRVPPLSSEKLLLLNGYDWL